MKATQIIYEGRVQGVGFRYTAKRIASGYDVSGWVKNLPDGRVELQLTGDKEEIRGFMEEIRESALAGHISAEHTYSIEVPTSFKGFQIQS